MSQMITADDLEIDPTYEAQPMANATREQVHAHYARVIEALTQERNAALELLDEIGRMTDTLSNSEIPDSLRHISRSWENEITARKQAEAALATARQSRARAVALVAFYRECFAWSSEALERTQTRTAAPDVADLEADEYRDALMRLLTRIGISPSDWTLDEDGMDAIYQSLKRIASGEIKTRADWSDQPLAGTIAGLLFDLRVRAGGFKSAHTPKKVRTRGKRPQPQD